MKWHESHTGMYGIWSNVSKQFVFGIQEVSKSKATNTLFDRIGNGARKWRFEVKPIKKGHSHMFKQGLIANRPDLESFTLEDVPAPPKPKVKKTSSLVSKDIAEKLKLNFEPQFYRGIQFQLINRSYAKGDNAVGRAKRFTLNGTNQNVWIPNKHLEEDGTLKEDENIDYVFRKAQRQLEIAGYTGPIIGIKRRSVI